MNDHIPHAPGRLTEQDQERAALFALGSLSAAESREFEAHVEICSPCRELVNANDSVAADLVFCATPSNPPPALEARLMESLGGRGRTRAFEPSDSAIGTSGTAAESYFLLASTGGWESTNVPGVECRTLCVDREQDRATMLFRMAPGSSYPAHRHSGPEECLVLNGDLRVGDVCMREGDFEFAAAGTEHGVQSTESGCLLLVSTSLADELL